MFWGVRVFCLRSNHQDICVRHARYFPLNFFWQTLMRVGSRVERWTVFLLLSATNLLLPWPDRQSSRATLRWFCHVWNQQQRGKIRKIIIFVIYDGNFALFACSCWIWFGLFYDGGVYAYGVPFSGRKQWFAWYFRRYDWLFSSNFPNYFLIPNCCVAFVSPPLLANNHHRNANSTAQNRGDGDIFAAVEGAVVGDNQFQQHLAENANALSTSYSRQQNQYVRLFIESIAANPSLAKAAALVDDPYLGPGVESPHFIVVCRNQSPLDNVKALKVMNKLLVNFLYSSKKGNGKHLAAGTWATRLKTLLSALKRNHGFLLYFWRFQRLWWFSLQCFGQALGAIEQGWSEFLSIQPWQLLWTRLPAGEVLSWNGWMAFGGLARKQYDGGSQS